MSKEEEGFLRNISDSVIYLMAIQTSFWSDVNVSSDLTNLLMPITSRVHNFSLYSGHVLLEPEGKECVIFERLCLWAGIRVVSAGTNKLRMHLLPLLGSQECSQKRFVSAADALKILHGFFFFSFSHKTIIFTSSSGVPFDCYVLQNLHSVCCG